MSQPQWNTVNLPGSHLTEEGGTWHFSNDPSAPGEGRPSYTNAQIDDYQGRRRPAFPWSAPLTLRVRARFSHAAGDLVGTAGFGFWNDPFLMTGARWPALPRAIWFFHGGPQTNLKLAQDVAGNGWKAACVDAIRPGFFALAPTAPLAVPLMNVKPLYDSLWPVGQRAIGVCEAALPPDMMTAWHDYELRWGRDEAIFRVDGETVLHCPTPPRGRLGFVMWIDNQAMTVTPWGRFGWRTVTVPHTQWLEATALSITPGE